MEKTGLPRLFWAGFLFIILLPGCKSQPPVQLPPKEEASGTFIDTSPRDAELVFLGVAGIRSRRQESINLALEEAARRVAVFQEVEGEFSARSNKGGRLLDYRAESSASLRHDPDYKKYLEALEFDEETDVFESENAVFVLARYPGSLSLNYRPSPPAPGLKPSWIDNPPATIGDYSVGVGYAGRRGAHRDTVTTSYENAVFAIIRNLYAVSRGQSVDYRGEGFLDISFTTSEELEARGHLSGFYVLETWTDPSDKSVWTLAIAKGKFF